MRIEKKQIVSQIGSIFWRLFPAAFILSGLEIVSAILMLLSFEYKFKPAAVKTGVMLLSVGLTIDAIATLGLLLTIGGSQGLFWVLGLAGRVALSSGLLIVLHEE